MKRNLKKKEVFYVLALLILINLFLEPGLYAKNRIFNDTTRNATIDSVSANAKITAKRNPQTIPVLFGQQNKNRLVQSVGYLNGRKLEGAPVTLLSNAFAGQLAGLSVQQSNGAPRFDNPNLSLRGRNPLIVIDGIPRYNLVSQTNANITSGINNQTLYDVLSLNPEQIASVVLLKDALATAMLGNQGMDGVLMITTRKSLGAPTVTFTAQAGIQTPLKMRTPLSAFDYVSLYNEAAVNSNFKPYYTQAQLDAYKNGTDPHLYPNINWNDQVLKKSAPLQRYNLSAGGTYSNIKYFLSLDYQSQGGIINEDPNTAYGTNVDYKRYVLRSNIEMAVDKRLSVAFNMSGNIQDLYQPGVGYAAIFNSLINTPNSATAIYNGNGTFAGTQQYPANPYAQAVSTGYLKNNLQALSADVSIKRKLDDLIKGAYLRAALSYSPSYEHQTDRSKNYNAYNYPVTGDTTQHLLVNTISDQNNASTVIEKFQQTYAEFAFGIDKACSKNVFNGMILGRYDNTKANNNLNQINQGISGRLSYSYDERFNLELTGAYNGNNRFAPGNRYDLYPAIGASWNINREGFFKGINVINELKLRASYGKVGNAMPGYYTYIQAYATGAAYFFGTGATNSPSVYEDDLANPNRVSEKANKLNIGLDVAYSQNRGWLNIDYYNNKQYDLLQVRGFNTSVFGQDFPLENIGSNKYYGIEINTGWTDKIGKLSYNISGNFSTVASKIIDINEPSQRYSWTAKTGNPVNQITGYVADGLFNSNNLTSATQPGFIPQPGDVKYKDLNADGVINQYDKTIIGNSRPLLFYGLDLGFQYGGLDFSVLLQGVANRDIMTTGNYEFPFTNNGLGQAFQYNLERYTPNTAATATLPRVTLGTDVNNYIASSLFVRNGNYIRLKNLEIGFSFGNRYLAAAKIKRARIFLRGENLLTWTKFKESDPEDYTGLYPIQQIMSGGLSVKF